MINNTIDLPTLKDNIELKIKSWNIRVVCLSSINANRVPCSLSERETLVQAGLGENNVLVPINCSSQEFYQIVDSVS